MVVIIVDVRSSSSSSSSLMLSMLLLLLLLLSNLMLRLLFIICCSFPFGLDSQTLFLAYSDSLSFTLLSTATLLSVTVTVTAFASSLWQLMLLFRYFSLCLILFAHHHVVITSDTVLDDVNLLNYDNEYMKYANHLLVVGTTLIHFAVVAITTC